MLERRRQELVLVEKQFGTISVGENLDWVIVERYPVPPGWSKTETALLVLIPSGYPTTPPDNFYTDNDLRLVGGGQPDKTTPNVSQVGHQWLQFSFHIHADWKPHADLLMGHNLLTFLVQGVKQRLLEAD